jgi:hypothetical protein
LLLQGSQKSRSQSGTSLLLFLFEHAQLTQGSDMFKAHADVFFNSFAMMNTLQVLYYQDLPLLHVV